MVLHEATVSGKQYTAKEAEADGIINQSCAPKELLPSSLALANRLTKRKAYDRSALQQMKRVIYADVLEAEKRNVNDNTSNIKSSL